MFWVQNKFKVVHRHIKSKDPVKAQVTSTVSMFSRRDFCFAIEAGVVICRLRFQSLSSRLLSASGKCCYFDCCKHVVFRDNERDVQPRPEDLTVDLRSLRSKMAPRKGFYKVVTRMGETLKFCI